MLNAAAARFWRMCCPFFGNFVHGDVSNMLTDPAPPPPSTASAASLAFMPGQCTASG
jgi:hypothetical protein